MEKIKVLVVDDAILVRKVLSDELAKDPDISVVGVAANGKIALSKIDQLQPDIVTLDVEMPEMDGLETLKRIRQAHATLPVIMVSGLTESGAAVTLDALSFGASDYVTKPSGDNSRAKFAADLVRRIHSICRFSKAPRKTSEKSQAETKTSASKLAPVQRDWTNAEVVAIGVSTGGPNALSDLLPLLANKVRVPVVITQHMPPIFTRLLAERLGKKSNIPTFEGVDGMTLQPGNVYLAPGDYHMDICDRQGEKKIFLHQGPQENSCRPAVDVMFRSVVKAYKGRVLAVIMTGMGCDGQKGCEVVRAAGGIVIVQDQASSVVWGMPGAVANAGLADQILSIPDLAKEILKQTGSTGHSNTERAKGASPL